MKSIFKYSLFAAAILAAQQVSALEITITGSTAFRSAALTAVTNLFSSTPTIAHNGTSLTGADFATFKGTLTGIGGTSYVYCSWSGSATGVIDTANGTPVPAISSTLVDGLTQGVTTGSQTTDTTKVAQLAFSDVYKESTSAASASLTDSRVAVIPFRFVRNKGSNAGITNVTAQQVRRLWAANTVPLRLFTGVSTDTAKVIGVGRDNGSGTRITVLAETKYGIGVNVQQWKITHTGTLGSGSISTAQIWPENDGVGSAVAGNGGYSSGSFIRDLMRQTSTSVELLDEAGDSISTGNNLTVLAWLGLNDANTAFNSGNDAVLLPYEGVPYSAAAVQQGYYTLWGYLHIYYGSLTTEQNTFRTNINTQLANSGVLGTNGIVFTSMNCSRTLDGGVVSP